MLLGILPLAFNLFYFFKVLLSCPLLQEAFFLINCPHPCPSSASLPIARPTTICRDPAIPVLLSNDLSMCESISSDSEFPEIEWC